MCYLCWGLLRCKMRISSKCAFFSNYDWIGLDFFFFNLKIQHDNSWCRIGLKCGRYTFKINVAPSVGPTLGPRWSIRPDGIERSKWARLMYKVLCSLDNSDHLIDGPKVQWFYRESRNAFFFFELMVQWYWLNVKSVKIGENRWHSRGA